MVMTKFAVATLVNNNNLSSVNVNVLLFSNWFLNLYLHVMIHYNVFFNFIIVFINLLFISLSLSILGMYIARIYNNSLSHKNFIVDYKKSYLG